MIAVISYTKDRRIYVSTVYLLERIFRDRKEKVAYGYVFK